MKRLLGLLLCSFICLGQTVWARCVGPSSNGTKPVSVGTFTVDTISSPNLAIWLKPKNLVNDGYNVTQWTNAGTSGYNFIQNDTKKRFRYDATGGPAGGPCARVNTSNNSYMIYDKRGLDLLKNKTGVTSFVVWKTSGPQTQSAFYASTRLGLNRYTHHRQNDSNGRGSITFQVPDEGSDFKRNRTYSSDEGVFSDGTWGVDTISVDLDKAHGHIHHNGRIVGDGSIWWFKSGSAFNNTNSGQILIGATGSRGQRNHMSGRMAELLVFDGPLTYRQKQAVWNYLHHKYGIHKAYGKEDTLILFDGDSIMHGLVKAKNTTPVRTVSELSGAESIYWRNDAITAQQVQEVESDLTDKRGILSVDYPSHLSIKNAIYSFSGGTNNVSGDAPKKSIPPTYDRIESLMDALTTHDIAEDSNGKPHGRIVATQLPRSNHKTTSNVFRLNTKITDNYHNLTAKGVEGIVDPTQLSQFDDATDVNDPEYYNQKDKIHPVAAGYALINPLHIAQVKQIRKRRQIENIYGPYIKAWYAAGEETKLNRGAVTGLGNTYGSSNTYDLGQTTSKSQPSYIPNARYGYPVIEFSDSASHKMGQLKVVRAGSGMLRGHKNVLMVGVMAPNNIKPPRDEVVFMASANGSNSKTRLSLLHTTDNKLKMYGRADDFGLAASLESTNTIGTDYSVQSVFYDFANTNASLWSDGVANGSITNFDNFSHEATLADTDSSYVGFGSTGGGQNAYVGTITEWIIMADIPNTNSDTIRDLIENYLGNKYGITVS